MTRLNEFESEIIRNKRESKDFLIQALIIVPKIFGYFPIEHDLMGDTIKQNWRLSCILFVRVVFFFHIVESKNIVASYKMGNFEKNVKLIVCDFRIS